MSDSIKQKIKKTNTDKVYLGILFILAIIFSQTQTFDSSSKVHIDKAFNRALITFGVSKALNGVISVAQGTEVAIQPAGIGINLTPGQILDPINDLIERFSWVMLASTISLGVQKTFLIMGIWPVFNYILLFILLISLILLISKTRKFQPLQVMFLRLSLILIVLRFAVPISGLSNEFVYQVFLENDYITASNVLESTTEQIGELNQRENVNQPDVKTKSVWESAKAFYNSTSEMLDISKRIEKYKNAAAETTRHIINLIVVFVFQTIIIPFLFIFIVYYLFKVIIKLDFNSLEDQTTSTGL